MQVRGVSIREAEAAASVLGRGDVTDACAGEQELLAVRDAGLGGVSRHALLRVLRAHRDRALRTEHTLSALHRYCFLSPTHPLHYTNIYIHLYHVFKHTQ